MEMPSSERNPTGIEKGRIQKTTADNGYRWRSKHLGSILLAIPAVFFNVVFLIAPLIVVLYYSLQQSSLEFVAQGNGGLSFSNYSYFFSQPYYQGIIFRSLRLSALATVGSLVIGYVTSLVLRGMAEKLGSTPVLILSFPILCGPIVTIMGWMGMMTSKGVLGHIIALVNSLPLFPDIPTLLLGTDAAVVIGMIHFNLTFVIFNLVNVMFVIPRELEEAAMVLGASRWQVFRCILWPLSLPGVFAASLISFALSMSSFVTPSYLGNAARPILTTQISKFMFSTYNWQLASTASVVLLVISLIIVILQSMAFRRVSTLKRWVGE